MKKNSTEIEIPFGVKDSELYQFTYTIPDGYSAEIRDGKVIVREKESEDERIRTRLIALVEAFGQGTYKEEMLAYLERQKEQKPAEWSEKDDAIHTRVLGALGKAFMGVLPTKPLQEDIEWFKSLPERFNLQPKQELDEDTAQWVECIIKDYEQKLVEEPNHAATIQAKITVLKSLRPSWKPSEEQMKALYSALNDAISLYSDEVSPLYEEISRTYFDTLESLYNDLKTL